MIVNELVQKEKERTGQKKTKMVPDTQVKLKKIVWSQFPGKYAIGCKT